jgi:hypothetical protein
MINPATILVLEDESADPILMQQMEHTTVGKATHGDGTFTRRMSVALIVGYSLFSIALVFNAPVLAHALNVWLLWIVVGIMSIVTFGIGMLRGRAAERFNQPTLHTPSRRMQHWMKN